LHDPSYFSHVSAALQTDRLREVDAVREARRVLRETQQLDREQRARHAVFGRLERLMARPSAR
jgi:GAF domain-containing protein